VGSGSVTSQEDVTGQSQSGGVAGSTETTGLISKDSKEAISATGDQSHSDAGDLASTTGLGAYGVLLGSYAEPAVPAAALTQLHAGPSNAIALSPDSFHLYSAGEDAAVFVLGVPFQWPKEQVLQVTRSLRL
jgi:hypothetical protein